MTLTVVIPTKGRETLERALESLVPRNQNGYGCDVLVVADTYGPMLMTNIEALCDKYGARYIEHNVGYNDWGYPQLIYGYKYGNVSKFVMNIGDDDEMVEGVIPRIDKIVTINGWHPYLFQAELYPSLHRGNTEAVILWNDTDRSIERKKVTGQNLVIPSIGKYYGNMVDDFEFIRQTIDKWNGQVTWVPVVTCRCY